MARFTAAQSSCVLPLRPKKQGYAPARTATEITFTQKGDTSNELIKGPFLKSFDKALTPLLTFFPQAVNPISFYLAT